MMNSIDVLKEIAQEHPNIEYLVFCEFESYDLIQKRINLHEKPLDSVFSSALKLRSKYSLPFWDSFNASLFGKKIDDYTFLKEINFHNNFSKKKIFKKNDFIKGDVSFMRYTTFSSNLNLDNPDLHLPLLDFHIPISNENQNICLNVLLSLNLKGYLLNSGKSYHFIGSELVNYEKLQDILFNALLFSPIIDKSWIAHQLLQKHCCLRVSKKYQRLPFLLRKVE